jgi:dienelactone hydrolase
VKTSAFRISFVSALLVLAACGTDSPTSTIDTISTARGTLVENPPFRIASLDATTLAAELGASSAGQQLLQVTGAPSCGVDFNYMHYWTVGGNNEAVSASGALMVPTGAAPACSGPRPILLYGHGVWVDKTLNIADITDPNNDEGALIAAMFAAQGYIVVAPNYVGYDTSNAAYHPFLNADAQSKDMIDALTAARKALGHVLAAATTDNGKLFIAGYSQGGFVAMATEKALEAAGTPVTAGGTMSGLYAPAATADYVFTGHVGLRAPLYYPMLVTSYQRAYGNVYVPNGQPGDFYEEPYASGGIDNLLPTTTPILGLIQAGKIPPLALFSSTAPVTGNATLDAQLAVSTDPLYSLGFGTGNLIKNTIRVSYVSDFLQNPDNALLALQHLGTDFSTAAAPAYGLRQDLKLNDLRSWVPTAPMILCGGSLDPLVFFPINTGVISAWWQSLGVPVAYTAAAIPTSLVTVLDLETGLGPGDPFAAAVGGFALAKQAVAAAAGGGVAGANAVVDKYHGYIVPPFCAAAVRGYFSQF